MAKISSEYNGCHISAKTLKAAAMVVQHLLLAMFDARAKMSARQYEKIHFVLLMGIMGGRRNDGSGTYSDIGFWSEPEAIGKWSPIKS